MDEAEIKFGDKIFVYGKMTDPDSLEELGLINPKYNTVIGYVPINGYYTRPKKTEDLEYCLPGFVTDSMDSLASRTLFSQTEMVDVTELLSQKEPSIAGTKVWMPIP